jgi:RNA polymerase sigma factor (sigma-70 family)
MSVISTSHNCDPDGGDGAGVADIARLYRQLSPDLERVVRSVVICPETIIEDACQFAWTRLVHHRLRVRRETALGWLAKTAIREAFKLSRRRAQELSLDEALEQGVDVIACTPEPWELVACQERMRRVRELPIRPQRLVWLQALGLSYSEMAAHEHCTWRTVDRQLSRARKALGAEAA